MLEAGINTWINTILFPFMPVITVFIVSALMLSDLPWNDDDDDDDGGGLISPLYNSVTVEKEKVIAEKLNGRFAMMGFIALVGAYLTTGQIIPGFV